MNCQLISERLSNLARRHNPPQAKIFCLISLINPRGLIMTNKSEEEEKEDLIKECLKLARRELNAAEYARLLKACSPKDED
jgi:hypothetical protein